MMPDKEGAAAVDAQAAASVAAKIAECEAALLRYEEMAAAAQAAYDQAAAEEAGAWRLYAPHDGAGTQVAAALYEAWEAASRRYVQEGVRLRGVWGSISQARHELAQLRAPGTVAALADEARRKQEARAARAAERNTGDTAAVGVRVWLPRTEVPGYATADAATAAAAMARCKVGWQAYMAARGAGDTVAQAGHQPAYTEYKRAYARLLELRKGGDVAAQALLPPRKGASK